MSVDDDFWGDAAPAPAPAPKPARAPAPRAADAPRDESPQLDLLSAFWGDEEGAPARPERAEAEEREQALVDSFFAESLENPTARRAAEEAKSRRVNVGLDPADAKLLEELFEQSRRAGLKNVSRARILRVALRHFHTCWLTRAD